MDFWQFHDHRKMTKKKGPYKLKFSNLVMQYMV